MSDNFGPIAVFGLAAAVLASVYRYIVRLAYFYDARADMFKLLGKTETIGIESATLTDCAQVLSLVSPDALDYPNAVEAVGKAVQALLKKQSE